MSLAGIVSLIIQTLLALVSNGNIVLFIGASLVTMLAGKATRDYVRSSRPYYRRRYRYRG